MTYKCIQAGTHYQFHNSVTRGCGNIVIPFRLTAAGQRSCLYRGAKLFNELDDNIKKKCHISGLIQAAGEEGPLSV